MRKPKQRCIARDLKRILTVVMLYSVAVGFPSCYYRINERIKVEVPEVVSYSTDIQSIWDTAGNGGCNKSGCHDGTWTPNLQSNASYNALFSGGYVNVADPASSEIYTSIIVGGVMQQYADPGNGEIILKWIEQGALNN